MLMIIILKGQIATQPEMLQWKDSFIVAKSFKGGGIGVVVILVMMRLSTLMMYDPIAGVARQHVHAPTVVMMVACVKIIVVMTQ